jgi:PAS domain-containing protein
MSNTTPAWSAHALLDDAPIGIARSTLTGKLVYANATLARLLEFASPAEIMRANTNVLYKHPAERAALIDLVRRTGTAQDQEVTLLTRTGAERVVLASLRLEGEILSTMMIDITARKQAEIDQQHSVRRLQVLADASRAFAEAGAEYPTVLDRVAETTATWLNERGVYDLPAL